MPGPLSHLKRGMGACVGIQGKISLTWSTKQPQCSTTKILVHDV
jgi:hypothetical protein